MRRIFCTILWIPWNTIMGLNNAMIYVDKHWVYYSLCVCVLGGGILISPPMVFYKVLWWCPQVDNEFKKYENTHILILKIVKFMKSASKTKLHHLLLSITSDAKYWTSQLHILHLTIEHNNEGYHKKNSKLNNGLLLLLDLWSKKNGFSILEYSFGPLDHACT